MSAPPSPLNLRNAAGRGVIAAAAFLVLTIGLVAVATAVSDRGHEARELLARLDAPHLLGGALVMSCGPVCLALRWRALFPPGTHANIFELTTLLLVGTLLNYALPGPVGEFVAAALAARRFGITAEAAFAAGILARFIGLGISGLAALSLLASGAVPLPEGARTWITTATIVIAGGAVALAVLAGFPSRLQALSAFTLGRFAFLSGLHASVCRFSASLGALGRVGWGAYARAGGWAVVGHLCVMTGVWIVGRGLNQAPEWPGLVFTYAASTAGAVVLFAFPGAQLGWDAMFASLLATTAGVGVATATGVTLFVRLQQLLLVTLGAIALVRWVGDGTERVGG